jgi:heptosyltransferase-3
MSGEASDRHPRKIPERPRVLVIRPDHLGDLLFVGPALARLRAAWPGAEISLLVGPWSAPVAERLPGVDRVEQLDFPWFNRRPKGAPWQPYLRLARAARALSGRFDVALVLRDDDGWSARLAAYARIPLRAGHDHPRVRPFATHILPADRRPAHTAAANIALVAALVTAPGGPAGPPPDPGTDPLDFALRPGDHEEVARLLGKLGSAAPIAIHPGSGADVKRWRPGAWAEVIHALTAPGETVILTGGEAERDLCAAVAACAARPVLDLAGRTDLGTLAALFARCRLVLGPDSGPLHLAVAVGTPTVHLFGPASAERFGPWGPAERHRVVAAELPCAPCGRLDWPDPADHPCVRTLGVARVIGAARGTAG